MKTSAIFLACALGLMAHAAYAFNYMCYGQSFLSYLNSLASYLSCSAGSNIYQGADYTCQNIYVKSAPTILYCGQFAKNGNSYITCNTYIVDSSGSLEESTCITAQCDATNNYTTSNKCIPLGNPD